MGISLQNAAKQRLNINAWNWGVIHQRVDQADLFPLELWHVARTGGGVELEPQQVTQLADFLEQRVLPRLSVVSVE